MRYLILSDIHGNLEALGAVLDHARDRYDQILNCGDLAGYGPDPNEVIGWTRDHCAHVIRGNHDKACAGLLDLEWFNPIARASTVWTAEILTERNAKYLRELPAGPKPVDGFQLIHGSPEDEDRYLIDSADAVDAAKYLDRAISFFGHTHIQGAFLIHRNGAMRKPPGTLYLEHDVAYLINPGSVGQPRDGDPRSAYAVYDTENRTVESGRVMYDIAATQRKIREAGLPDQLALRLENGC